MKRLLVAALVVGGALAVTFIAQAHVQVQAAPKKHSMSGRLNIRQLAEQMHQVADLIQVGDADRATEAARIAVRLARGLLPRHVHNSIHARQPVV